MTPQEPTIAELKNRMRREARQRLATLPPEIIAPDSARISDRIRLLPEWNTAHFVLGFLPLRSEPDLTSLLQNASDRGVTVCVPRWNPTVGAYDAAILPPEADRVPGAFGIPEPPPGAPSLPMERLDLVLVPGLAFDRLGRRLGRGRGFFDRILAHSCRARRWGVAFDLQIVDAVPTEPHDVNVHRLVTPQLTLRAGE